MDQRHYQLSPAAEAIFRKYSGVGDGGYLEERYRQIQIELIELYMPDMDQETKRRALTTLSRLRAKNIFFHQYLTKRAKAKESGKTTTFPKGNTSSLKHQLLQALEEGPKRSTELALMLDITNRQVSNNLGPALREGLVTSTKEPGSAVLYQLV